MKKSLTRRLTGSPIWIILGIGLLVVAGLLLIVVLLNPKPAAPAPTSSSVPNPTATTAPTTASLDATAAGENAASEPLAASVNGYTITQSYLSRTVRLNQVLGDLSGTDVLGKEETLQRLINSQLILQGTTTVEEPSSDEVETTISSLEENWGVDDETVVQKLQAVGLERDFLVDTIERLLAVQTSVEKLEEEGHNVSEWLQEQKQDADIMVREDLARTEEAEATPTAEPTDQAELPTSTPAEPATSTPRPQPEVVDAAPNFTLDQAGGGSFVLSDQLEEGPVVLVFFEKCG